MVDGFATGVGSIKSIGSEKRGVDWCYRNSFSSLGSIDSIERDCTMPLSSTIFIIYRDTENLVTAIKGC